MAFLSGSSNLFAARLKCTVDLAKSYLELELILEGSFAVSHLKPRLAL
jgi:hypothetical protein